MCIRDRDINQEMLLAAVHAIASSVKPEKLKRNHIIPSIFDLTVQPRVAAAVMEAAQKSGVARSHRMYTSPIEFE